MDLNNEFLTSARNFQKPRVTVVVPCFNQEVFLFECLNSLIAQTMPGWEAFVVDDCSPHRISERIVASYDDPRIHCIRHDANRGLAVSRNTGLDGGSAPVVVCIDADDFLHPEFLSATLGLIEERGVDCAYTEFQLVGLSQDVWTFEPKSKNDIAKVQWIPGPGTVMRRAVWERVGGYSPELRWNEDWDFWIAAIDLGFSVARVPRSLYFYRRHAKTATATLSEMLEWRTREVILKKRAAFFAVGDRARVFRADGLLRSAHANRTAAHRWQSVVLTARAFAVRPELLVSEAKAAIRRRLRWVRKIQRRAQSIIQSTGQKYFWNGKSDIASANDTDQRLGWDAYAPVLHSRYGYLSHDYDLLGDILDKVGAHFVLEIGCGTGRLVPVYLVRDVRSIWLQDVSGQALEICRRRFFCQRQIQYFEGDIQSIPTSAAPDVIVANRVLQHILHDAELRELLTHLMSMTRYFYVNETGIEEAAARGDPYLRGRDYGRIFSDLGCRLVAKGELTAEGGARQTWMLFARDAEPGGASSAEQRSTTCTR
jgi:glycosyltransferase involved in cell wall biosynthesis